MPQESTYLATRAKLRGSLLLILVAIIWGTAFVFQRVGMERIEPITFTASRMTLAALAVGMVAVSRRRKSAAAGAENGNADSWDMVAGGICCGAFLAFASIFQQMGIVHTAAGKAGFITALYILIVPVIGLVLFGKRYSWSVWLAVLLGMTGMYLLCMTERFQFARGDMLLCVCAILFSGHILCCDYFVRKGDPICISAIQFVVAAIISWIAAFIMESPSSAKIKSAMVPILYCGIVSGGLGYTLQIVGQKHTDPAVASLLLSLESVFAVIAGAVILDEHMIARELLGCIVMFAAIVIVQLHAPKAGPVAAKTAGEA